jgi:hypothetical protein
MSRVEALKGEFTISAFLISRLHRYGNEGQRPVVQAHDGKERRQPGVAL